MKDSSCHHRGGSQRYREEPALDWICSGAGALGLATKSSKAAGAHGQWALWV